LERSLKPSFFDFVNDRNIFRATVSAGPFSASRDLIASIGALAGPFSCSAFSCHQLTPTSRAECGAPKEAALTEGKQQA
jgi:hypothetical protein